MGIPNLISNSQKQIKAFAKEGYVVLNNSDKKKGFRKIKWQKKEWFLFFYGICNSTVTILFIGIILTRYWQEVWHFPASCMHVISHLLTGSWRQINMTFGFLLVAGFYGLLIKYMIQKVVRWYRRNFMKPENRDRVS